MITNSNEALALIEDRIKQEEKDNANLQETLRNLSGEEKAKIAIPETANFRMGKSRFNRTLQTDVNFQKLYQILLQSQADFPDKFAFELADHKVWIRTDADVKDMFVNHFGRKDEFIKFIDTCDQEFCEITALKLDEIISFEEECVRIYLGILKCDWFLYLSVPTRYTFEELNEYLLKINPKLKNIRFMDCDNNLISNSDNDAWDYIKCDAKEGIDHGKFSAIIME
ncbi:hypothetical protein TVAG_486860 [Trichomonas vaginalis G3]|uniref:Uncharacterized protein n=1 Tax=Trichomonas vaginalis (strain ATCC PRA-98 / G3) TaxID=412133 RepID=A2DZB4_TRIV3|nr:hypothetical protein TVAGG3_1017330 [Trichomonas vaginalis G3]EAY14243.1 hypothetical protein TVAG_486860 [Trichomonas vaginalis G3]KAI5491899.1 hypothetical protein TVAGG3_1017330 [Trichomonas vaginalis G3]|eukprot:XP_001326466.1 hypothetical protein [Trichomonas vaginalis G3]